MMKKKIIKSVFITILVLCCGFYLYSRGTYTSYESEVSGGINPSIAKWNINVNGKKITTTDVSTIDISDITWTTNHVTDNKAAPGSIGTIQIIIDPLDTDVAIKYSLEIVDKSIDEDKLLRVTGIRDENANLIKTGVNTYTGVITLDSNQAKTIYLDIEWSDDREIDYSSDELDNNSNFLIVNFVANQYKGETIVPYAG